MPVQIKLTLSQRFDDYARDRKNDAAQAWTLALRAATQGAQNDLRQQLARAFPGSPRAPNIVGSKVFPPAPKFSLGAAGTVFPRGKPGSSPELIVEAFSRGVTIRARNRKFLAIPTEFVPIARAGVAGVSQGTSRRTTSRMTPAEVEAHFGQKLAFVPSKKGGGVLILRAKGIRRRRGRALPTAKPRGDADRVMFILVAAARLPKRLDLDSIIEKWAAAMPDLVDRALPD